MTRAPAPTFWQLPLNDLLRQLDASPYGLSAAVAVARLRRFGANALRRGEQLTFVRKLLSRFHNPLVLILLAAAVVSALTGDFNSFSIIVAIVAISVTLDSIQEHRAEAAAERLKGSVALTEQVLRDGQECTIRAEQLVVPSPLSTARPGRSPALPVSWEELSTLERA